MFSMVLGKISLKVQSNGIHVHIKVSSIDLFNFTTHSPDQRNEEESYMYMPYKLLHTQWEGIPDCWIETDRVEFNREDP